MEMRFMALMLAAWFVGTHVVSDNAGAAGTNAADPTVKGDAAAKGGDTTAAARQFAELVDQLWQFELEESPLFATDVGDHRYDDRLPEVSLAARKKGADTRQQFLQRLAAINRSALDRPDQINYDILRRQLGDEVSEYKFGSYLMPITNRSGFHISFPELAKRVPLRTVEDYENYIARLAAFDEYAQGYMALMREGIKQSRTLPAVVLEGYRPVIESQVVDDPTQSLLYEPFREFPDSVPVDQRDRLREAGRQAIAESVVPGYESFLMFMTDEYVPAARSTIGAAALPDGREFYRHRVRSFTTLDVTPEEVHQIGLDEVKRIRGEMLDIIKQVKFDGDFEAFVEFLRTDPQFYATSPEELMKEVALVLKTMDGHLPELFKTLPRSPYGIRPVPDYIAPRTTTAYYQGPAGDGTRAGFYFVNTFDLKSRPLYEIEALSLHEAVPGHHLQIALQQELVSLPEFRRFDGFTAFVEGWALYAESLGREVGFYQDPYRDFGRLTYEMWRACRLVVDTGIHYFGWTRQQAIDYMAANTALSLHNIEAEVDRYISWPGQALAYKMGELKIRELRRRAEQQLGEQFDVREFHDVVLGSGGVPLDVLEANVEGYITEAQRKTNEETPGEVNAEAPANN